MFGLYLLNRLGASKSYELNQIKRTINSIRQNEIKSPDEIHIGKYLVEIEGEIKAMFFRTQNDIANLKKLELMRTEFLGNVSHELRTPIFAIQGYLETLLNGAIEDPKVNKGFLEKAIQHTTSLNSLLNDLIDLSMIESGQMKMSFRYFHIKEYLTEIINSYQPIAQEKGLSIELGNVRGNLQLYGDKKWLRQVMVNLVSNAIKYSESGVISVTVDEEPKFGKITVKDQGHGIPEIDKERIFERFYRVEKGRSKLVGGTGLGLAIVKHIIDAHNSKIQLESELGKGSEFSFKLKK